MREHVSSWMVDGCIDTRRHWASSSHIVMRDLGHSASCKRHLHKIHTWYDGQGTYFLLFSVETIPRGHATGDCGRCVLLLQVSGVYPQHSVGENAIWFSKWVGLVKVMPVEYAVERLCR